MGNSIYDCEVIYNCFLELRLKQHFRRLVLRHIMSILVAVFMLGYKGKANQMSQASEKHRTTVAYFLNHGK